MSEAQIAQQLDSLEQGISYSDQLDIEQIVFRAILACNQSISGDTMKFNANVRALFCLMPAEKKKAIEDRQEDYIETIDDWEYQYTCGVRVGTPENPITLDGKPPNEEWSNVISPIPIQREEYDYEILFEIIMESLQGVGLTWSSTRKTIEIGKVVDLKAPASVVTACERAIVTILLEARREEPLLSFDMIIQDLKFAVPRTPKLRYEDG